MSKIIVFEGKDFTFIMGIVENYFKVTTYYENKIEGNLINFRCH